METPLGRIKAAALADEALCGLWFFGQKYFPLNTDSWIVQADNPVFHILKSWLDVYFSSGQQNLNTAEKYPQMPLAPKGTAFQQSVWKLLLEIPYGSTCTYGEIADKLGMKGQGVRAVAGAVGHNPISVIIPCHRVIGTDGTLKGYAGGIDRKKALLKIEGFSTL